MKIYSQQLGFAKKSLVISWLKLLIFSKIVIISQSFVEFFVSGNELQVWTKKDRHGRISWHAYDPEKGQRVSLDTESELREWIERRYYKS